jgi:hypothetical protein
VTYSRTGIVRRKIARIRFVDEFDQETKRACNGEDDEGEECHH